MKKVLSMILAAIMAFGCFAVFGSASEDFDTNYNAADYAQNYVCTKTVMNDSVNGKYTDVYTYDSNGNKIKAVHSDNFGTSTYTYTYDSKGNVIKTVVKGDGTSSTTTSSYNSFGYLAKSAYKSSDGETGSAVNTYDSKGRVTKYVYKSGSQSYTYKYTYDSNGNRIKMVTANETDTYAYNSKGYLTKQVTKYTGSKTTTTKTYAYDSNGNLTKEVQSYSDGSKFTASYTYDSKGNLTKETTDNAVTTYTYNSKGSVTKETYKCDSNSYTRTYTYDSNNNNTKIVYKDSDNLTNTTTFAYDSHGNLIKEIYKNSRLNTSTTTTFTYKKLSSPICVIEGQNGFDIHVQYASTTYTGSAKKPNVTVEYNTKGTDYTVSYSNNVNPGKGKIKITFPGRLQQPVTITFDIKPAKPTDMKASSTAATSTKLSWTKVTGATGYVIYKYNSSTGTYTKVGTSSTASYTVKSLKSATTYKFAVKAYTKTSSGNLFSAYSSLATVKTK